MKIIEKINKYILDTTLKNFPILKKVNPWLQCIITGVLAGIIVPFYITMAVIFIMFLIDMPLWFTGALIAFSGVCFALDKFFDFPEIHMGQSKPTQVDIPKRLSKRERNRGTR